MKLSAVFHPLQPRHAFRIARPRQVPHVNVLVRITDRDGLPGYGEASPNPFYGETPGSVYERLSNAAPLLEGLEIRSPADISRFWKEAWPRLQPSRAAQCALDVALWDLLATREHTTVPQLAFGRPARPVATFATLGLSTPEELPAKLEELAGFDRLKITSDLNHGITPLLAARSRFPGARLALDANGGWNPDRLGAWLPDLLRLGLLFLEQPVPPAAAPPRLPNGLLLMADESVVQEEDLVRIPPEFGGFNIKLVKCGGLTPALRMLRQGKERGLQTLVGCMLESSVLIAAGAVAAQESDHADLDGAWLLSNDPFTGWTLSRGSLHPTDLPGLGVRPAPGLFDAS